jgi:peptidoglycan/LPS O-acetylase OafA/YrhL
MSHAVTVFFVLSGFVIAYATDRGEDTAVSYGVSRASRIYSVALPALFVTFLLDRIGQDFRPEFYTSAWGYESAGQWFSFPICAVFLNEIWFFHISPGSDLPYWSLGYEVWYYIIFGVFLFSRRKWLMVSAILLLVGPKIVSMLPLWLFGVAAYRLSIRWGARNCSPWPAF